MRQLPGTAVRMVLVGVLITLTGCAGHVHRFSSDNASSPVSGMFRHGGGSPPELIVDVAGVRYQSKGFQIAKRQSLTELRRALGAGKHFDQIASGQDSEHLEYFASPELVTDSGLTMQCHLSWRAGKVPSGSCRKANGDMVQLQSL